MALNALQRLFVSEYLIDKSAGPAAERAGYSKKSAYTVGPRLLRNAHVRAAIDEALAAQEKRTLVTADRVLQELARIALFDPKDLFDADGNLLDLKDMPEDARRAVASVEVETEVAESGKHRGERLSVVSKVKLWDKPKALELIGRHLKMFVDKLELGDGGPITVQIVRYGKGKGRP